MNPIEVGFVPLQAAADQPSIFQSMLIPISLTILIFYLLVFRPQQKQQRDHAELLKGIEKNDNVVTAGGLHGKVVGIADDVLTVEIAALKGERVRVKISRAKVESVTKGKKDDES